MSEFLRLWWCVSYILVAGVSAEVDGGKFGNGFVSSLLSSGADSLGLSQIKNSFARVVANAIVAGTISEVTGGKFANGVRSAAFRVAFNEVGEKTELQEQKDRNKDYLEYVKGLNKSEKKALLIVSTRLSSSHGMDVYNNSARQNSIIGLGVFEVDESYKFSDASDNSINGVLDNSPTGRSCYGICQQPISDNIGLQLLIFRDNNGSRNTMWANSSRMQNLSNQGNVPVILRDAYFNISYLWKPEGNENQTIVIYTYCYTSNANNMYSQKQARPPIFERFE